MIKQIVVALVVILLLPVAWAEGGATTAPRAGTESGKPKYKIVTGSERGTAIVMGRDLAEFVAPDAGIQLESLPSAGSAENVVRLRVEPGVKLAIVQSDVYQALLDRATVGNPEAAKLIQPLRIIVPLYNEEIYFIVRADSPLNYVHEIKDKRINAGIVGSGTALTSVTLYQAMFHGPIPKATTTFLSEEDALIKLTGDKSLDVVIVIAGQPAKLLADMKPGAKRLIKLLKFDATDPASRDALKTYFPATVLARNYPNLLSEDLPSLAVKAFLVTYAFDNAQQTDDYLANFARSLCQNMHRLQEKGHPKWKDVQLSLPELGEGWRYYAPTSKEIRACGGGRTQTTYQSPIRGACAQEDLILGLCRPPGNSLPPPTKLASATPPTKLASAAPPTKLASAAPPTKLASAAPPAKPVPVPPPAKVAPATPPVKVVSAAPPVKVVSAAPPVKGAPAPPLPEAQSQAPPPPETNTASSGTNVIPAQPLTKDMLASASPTGVHTPAALDRSQPCKPPEYPMRSRHFKETGTVFLRFLIDADGTVLEKKIATSSKFERLDQAALDALSLCRFKPGTADGKPEQSWATLKYVWKLE